MRDQLIGLLARALKFQGAFYFIILAIGAAVVASVVFLFRPETAPWYVFAGFYAGIFLVSTALSGFLGIICRKFFGLKASNDFEGSSLFRQSLLLGLAVLIASILQVYRILNPTTTILLVLSMGILELYFSSR